MRRLENVALAPSYGVTDQNTYEVGFSIRLIFIISRVCVGKTVNQRAKGGCVYSTSAKFRPFSPPLSAHIIYIAYICLHSFFLGL